MKRFFKIVGIVFLVILAFVVIMFLSLYIRYTKESVAIHRSVDAFVSGIETGSSIGLDNYIHPNFKTLLEGLLVEHGELFKNISGVHEKSWYFSYTSSTNTGETTEYKGDAQLKTGGVDDITIDLVKYNGIWVVYGVHIDPKPDSKK